jgi:hypothetical protein
MLQNERYTGVYRHPRDGVFLNTFKPIVPQHLFDTVRRLCKENGEGGNARQEPYLLRNKLRCGYCGKTIRGDAGTSKSGKVMKYYTCSGRKQINDKCKKQILRKDDLEKLVIDITLKTLNNQDALEKLIDKICEINEERAKTNNTLAILYSEVDECQKSMDNLIKAMEQGIVSKSTQKRVKELEDQIDDLNVKISVEESKVRLKLSKPEILKFINKAIHKEPWQMIRLLIKQIVLYDDKIEIYYNISERTRPDEEQPRQAFCFYSQVFQYVNMAWWYTMKSEGRESNIEVYLYI